jgi:hypothetical protein
MPAEILLITRIGQESGGVSFSARCHAGSLKLGDLITTAIDPAGDRHAVNVTCVGIRFTPQIMVDELEANFGGLITLAGASESTLTGDWTLLIGSGLDVNPSAKTHARWVTARNRAPDTSNPDFKEAWVWEQCGICKFWLPLAGPLGADWGVCSNPDSSFDRTAMFEHDGCDFFEEDPKGWRTPHP